MKLAKLSLVKQLQKALKQTEKKLSDSQVHSNGLETKLQKTESDSEISTIKDFSPPKEWLEE